LGINNKFDYVQNNSFKKWTFFGGILKYNKNEDEDQDEDEDDNFSKSIKSPFFKKYIDSFKNHEISVK